MFLKLTTTKSTEDKIKRLKEKINTADAVIIGAGAGLSTAAGFDYGGERFRKYFSDFEEKYGIHDLTICSEVSWEDVSDRKRYHFFMHRTSR